MTQFNHGPITQIPTDKDTVYAFRMTGHIDDDAAEALAKYMNTAFETHDKVNMLLDMTGFTGSDWNNMFDSDVIESRFRALSHVARYAVVGAPEKAANMIGMIDKVIPVEARAFASSQMDEAWGFVGAKPIAAAA